MKLVQNGLSSKIFLDPMSYLKGQLVYVQKQKKISHFRPCVLNKGTPFNAESMVHLKII